MKLIYLPKLLRCVHIIAIMLSYTNEKKKEKEKEKKKPNRKN